MYKSDVLLVNEYLIVVSLVVASRMVRTGTELKK